MRSKSRDTSTHMEYALFCSNIGKLFMRLDDLNEALQMHSQVLAIEEKVLGNEHPDKATAYNNIGHLMQPWVIMLVPFKCN